MNETALRNWCLEYLHRVGVMAWKNNTGAFKSEDRFIRFGVAGAPDILGILASQQGRLLCIETKVGNNRLSQAQAQWLMNAYSNGATCAVIYTPAEMEKFVQDGYGSIYWTNKLYEHIKNAKPDKIKGVPGVRRQKR